VIGRCGAQGTRGASRRVAELLRVALLTEIAPAVDTSTVRQSRRSLSQLSTEPTREIKVRHHRSRGSYG
jgi:hypothetical protein